MGHYDFYDRDPVMCKKCGRERDYGHFDECRINQLEDRVKKLEELVATQMDYRKAWLHLLNKIGDEAALAIQEGDYQRGYRLFAGIVNGKNDNV